MMTGDADADELTALEIVLPPDEARELHEAAARLGVEPEEIIRRAVADALAALER